MTDRPRILVVEDDETLGESIGLLVDRTGMAATVVADGRRALDVFRAGTFDAVLLDLMLPGISGLDVCRELRRDSRVPILMVTARAELTDVVAGLEIGADDYITKPFEAAELIARMRAVLRRSVPGDVDMLRVGDLAVDAEGFRVWRAGEELTLSPIDFRLVLEFVRQPGKALSRELLLERVWHADYLGQSRLVDMAVKRLRDKIEHADGACSITTVRGVGYRLDVDLDDG